MYVLKDKQDIIVDLSSLSFFTIPIIMIWFFKGYYGEKSLLTIIGRVFLILLIILFSLIILMIASVLGGCVFAMIKGLEAIESLEYYTPK